MSKCSIKNCKIKFYAKGFCGVHYQRMRKYGNPLIKKSTGKLRYSSNKDRLMLNIVKLKNGCWNYKFICNMGYGTLMINGKTMRAHRYSFELHHKPIPKGMIICHKCDNPKCVNPEHLFLGDYNLNNKDKAAKGRSARFFGSKNPNSKLNEKKVEIIKALLLKKINMSEIAKKYGVLCGTISKINCGTTWASVKWPKPKGEVK